MLTSGQLATLKAVAAADQTAATYMANGMDVELAAWFNTASSFVVWRSSLSPDQFRAALINGAIQLDNLTAGKRDTLFFLAQGSLVVSSPAVRTALDDLMGTQATLKAAVLAAEKRNATRAEQALASGTGSDANPGTLGWEGQISQAEASWIRG